MPVLKVSEALVKEAMELIRINITVLGDCPQCNGSNYRSGVCEDCAFISPEVMEAIQEWQQAQGIQQKAATRRFSFVEMLERPSTTLPSARDTQCPGCGKYGFDLECDHCGHSDRSSLEKKGLERPDSPYTGINRKDLDVRRRVKPTADVYNSKRKRNKKQDNRTVAAAKIEVLREILASTDLGAVLDDSQVVKTDASSRIWDAQKSVAEVKAQENAQGSPDQTQGANQ